VGVVTFGGAPAHIPDHLITAIRNRLDDLNTREAQLSGAWKTGEVVAVDEGPFRGYEAILDVHVSGDERVRVLLKLLSGQHIPVELPVGHIRRKKQ
jgi:transcriptional antiterminator RfaH